MFEAYRVERALIVNMRNAAYGVGSGTNDPSNRCSCDSYIRYDSYDGAVSKVRHDHGSSEYYAPPDCYSHGTAHVSVCQVQSN